MNSKLTRYSPTIDKIANLSFDFLSNFNYWQDIKLILHQGAMTNTRETNKQLFNKYNFEFSIELFKKAIQYKIPIKYASSASVYGNNEKGFDPHLIETALAHADKNTVRAAYNRAEYIKDRRDMMEWWSNHIASFQTQNIEN